MKESEHWLQFSVCSFKEFSPEFIQEYNVQDRKHVAG